MLRIGRKGLLLALLTALAATSFTAAAFGGSKELVIAKSREALALDPQDISDTPSEEINHAIYEGLVTFDEKLNVVPMLAKEWSHSEDGLEWTFKLKEGIAFHSGTPFDAEAVKVNFDRILNGKYKRTSLYAPVIKEISVVDDHTVKFTLKESFGPFLNVLAHTAGLILDPSYVQDPKKNESIKHRPSGTGPFMLDEWEQGDYIALKANKKYWQGKPKIDRLVFRTVPEDSARAMMIETGEVDIAEQIPPTDVERLLKNKKVDMKVLPSIVVQFVGVNCQNEVLKDPAVRRALAYSIDRQAICDKILMGYAEPVNSMVAPLVNGYSEVSGFTYDPEKAKATLEEAGWADSDGDGIRDKDGKKLTVEFWTHGRDTLSLKVPQAVQSFASAVGFDCKMKVMDWGAFLAATRKPVEESTSQLMWLGWSPSTGDADWVYRPLVHSDYWQPKGPNRPFYSNEIVDENIMVGFHSVDQDERREAYRKAQEILNQELPWIPLYTRKTLHAFSKKLEKVEYLPLDFVVISHETDKK